MNRINGPNPYIGIHWIVLYIRLGFIYWLVCRGSFDSLNLSQSYERDQYRSKIQTITIYIIFSDFSLISVPIIEYNYVFSVFQIYYRLLCVPCPIYTLFCKIKIYMVNKPQIWSNLKKILRPAKT